ncbi:MAG: hypothetical protein AB7V16_13615 [Vulcanibacillus sp.]
MIKTLINSTLLTILTATPGVVGVSSAYYPETENTNVLNERLGWYDYGLATENYNGIDKYNIDINGAPHLQLIGYYKINASQLNQFLPTLQTWYLPLGEINIHLDTTTNNVTSFFKVKMYDSQSISTFYTDQKPFTTFDLAMIKEGMPIQLKEWNTNNYEPSEIVDLEITVQLKLTESFYTQNYTSVIGNKDFYVWLLIRLAQQNIYDDAYGEGYDDGYDKGYDVGYNVGLDEGGDGTAVNNVFALLEKGWNGMANMLEIEVFPNFTIGGLLLIPLLFTIGLFIFKVLT